jgi:hypothetical protein
MGKSYQKFLIFPVAMRTAHSRAKVHNRFQPETKTGLMQIINAKSQIRNNMTHPEKWRRGNADKRKNAMWPVHRFTESFSSSFELLSITIAFFDHRSLGTGDRESDELPIHILSESRMTRITRFHG